MTGLIDDWLSMFLINNICFKLKKQVKYCYPQKLDHKLGNFNFKYEKRSISGVLLAIIFRWFPVTISPYITYVSWLGLCKLENENLKEAKNPEKSMKNHILDRKISFLAAYRF